MIPLCPTCNGTGRAHDKCGSFPCDAPGPTLLDLDGNPVHAGPNDLVRWCETHDQSTIDIRHTLLDYCHEATVSRHHGASCRPVWATVTTWQEATDG